MQHIRVQRTDPLICLHVPTEVTAPPDVWSNIGQSRRFQPNALLAWVGVNPLTLLEVSFGSFTSIGLIERFTAHVALSEDAFASSRGDGCRLDHPFAPCSINS